MSRELKGGILMGMRKTVNPSLTFVDEYGSQVRTQNPLTLLGLTEDVGRHEFASCLALVRERFARVTGERRDRLPEDRLRYFVMALRKRILGIKTNEELERESIFGKPPDDPDDDILESQPSRVGHGGIDLDLVDW